jgi:diguanylate cyclase (GGDEF)-like protein
MEESDLRRQCGVTAMWRDAGVSLWRMTTSTWVVGLAVALLLPMAFITRGYVDIQKRQVAFSARERDGVAYLRPVMKLLVLAVAARHAAISGTAPDRAGLRQAVAGVDAVDARYGAGLGVSGLWATVRSDAVRSADSDPGLAGATAYGVVARGTRALIVAVSDNSNLTLDPELDSYYVVDAVVLRLPAMVDLIGQAVDAAVAAGPAGAGARAAATVRVARATGALNTTRAALESGLATAFGTTKHAALRSLRSTASAERTVVTAVLDRIDEATATGNPTLLTTAVGERARTALLALFERLVPQLDALLAIRIAALQDTAFNIGSASLLSVALIVVMVLWIHRSARARQHALTHGALVRHAASTANSAEAFRDAAATVVAETCTRLGWLAGHAWTTSDEPSAWFIADHQHHDQEGCRLAALAAEGGSPGSDQLPVDTRTRIASGPRELSGLGTALDGCGISTAVAVPVLTGGAAAGMLAFYLPSGSRAPRPDLIAALEQIGVNLGQVIERQRAAAVLFHQATHDVVTGVANRRRLLDEIAAAQVDQAAGRSVGRSSAVLLLDLDRFRQINDSLGYAAGDVVLREAAARLVRAIPDDALGARLGADQFVVLAHHRPSSAADPAAGPFTALAHRILQSLHGSVSVGGHQVPLRASVGICLLDPGQTESASTVLRDADTALRHAKRRGKEEVQVFDAALRHLAATRILDETALADAVERDELLLHYQPIIDLPTGQPVGTEALVRWQRPGRGMVPPGDFIPLAEDSGLIIDLGRWVLRRACRDAAAWPRTAPRFGEATVSVNVSTRQLTHPRFLADLDGALRDSDLPPRRLIVEITETALIDDHNAVMSTLHAIRARGVELALDDFGTGYSSMSYVQNLPVSILKIDKSFVDPITGPGDGTALSEVVLKLAEAAGLRTVAEGVETAVQADALRRLGCHRGQGYLWSPPVPAERLAGTVLAAVANVPA